LQASADTKLKEIADVLTREPGYAHLGAIGPALGDFIPSDRPADLAHDPNGNALVWKKFFGLMGGPKGFYQSFVDLQQAIDRIWQVAVAEDMPKICAMNDSGEIGELSKKADAFMANVQSLQTTAIEIGKNIGKDCRPNVDTPNPTDPVPPPETWLMRDFLHWRKPGRFVQALISKARARADDRLLAYAYGYLVSYSGQVCGAPFINSIVGGPSRTQWWRQRFAKNYVDAWVYGFYRVNPTFAGDNPTPNYDTWPSLCNANLQDKLALGGTALGTADAVALMETVKLAKPFPAVLPQDFSDLWFEAFRDAYGAVVPPTATAASLNGAYLMTWLVLWFRTSGTVFGCQLVPPVAPPDGCGAAPSELDPFVPAPGGGPSPPPPQPNIDHSPNVCGILLAILSGLLFLGGAFVAGGASLAGAIALLDCPHASLDWKGLRCNLYWYKMYIFNGLRGVQHLLALSGFGYPEAGALKQDEDEIALLPIKFESGVKLVKSRGRTQAFPSKPWWDANSTSDDLELLKFNQPPDSSSPGFETPRTLAYYDSQFPNFFVDDDVHNPLSNGDIKTPGAFPARLEMGVTGALLPMQFGNAVANAVDLFSSLNGNAPPDWNLDGDRATAYHTWQFNGVYDPDAVNIKPEP
jgi:hypothetical protein